jgi:hypothetical protein
MMAITTNSSTSVKADLLLRKVWVIKLPQKYE